LGDTGQIHMWRSLVKVKVTECYHISFLSTVVAHPDK